ncbi:MAG: hypothetical protein ACRD5H_02170, partial [Nitrososphaerales archaeon]
DTFGRDQIKVVIFEEFIQLPEQVVNEVLAFLGLSYTVTSINKQHNPYSVPRSAISLWIYSFFRRLRASGIRTSKVTSLLPGWLMRWIERSIFKRAQKPNIDPKSVQFLQSIFYDDVIRLQSMLGRSLPWPAVLGNKIK